MPKRGKSLCMFLLFASTCSPDTGFSTRADFFTFLYDTLPEMTQTYEFNLTDSRLARYWYLTQTPAHSQPCAAPVQAHPSHTVLASTGLCTHLPHMQCLWVFELKQR